jgi:hypothetical protein
MLKAEQCAGQLQEAEREEERSLASTDVVYEGPEQA